MTGPLATPRKVALAEKLGLVTEPWQPKIVGELNGQHVKVVKLEGEFIWHHHDVEEELFLVVKGRMRLDYRDPQGGQCSEVVGEGEFIIVPAGVEHRPVAEEEAHVVLFEPKTTVNTGQVRNDRTVVELEELK